MSTRRRRLAALAALILVPLALWGWVPPSHSVPGCGRDPNAAWISVDWTSQPIDDDAVRELADAARRRSLRYLYPYVTYVKADGSFSPSFDHAAEFVSAYRAHDPDTELLAWIGVPLKNDRKFGVHGTVDLSDEAARRSIVTFAADLVADAGFDGVHLNVETVENGDAGFLRLLEETRVAMGPGRKLSIAGSHWVPDWVNALPVIRDFRWTGGYYAQVAQRVDQISTMTYDSHLPLAILYRPWMREEVRGIRRSLAGEETELLIGVSVSRESSGSRRANAEGLGHGLAGLCAGLDGEGKSVDGVAIYADWDFSPGDLAIWTDWLENRASAGIGPSAR